MSNEIVIAVLGIVNVAFITWQVLIKTGLSNKKLSLEGQEGLVKNYENLVKTHLSEIEKLRIRVDDLQGTVDELEKENRQLHIDIEQVRTNFVLLEASNLHLPLPYWIKDRSGRMLFINESYEKEFNANLDAYKGKTDIEYWSDVLGPVEGKLVGQEYQKNDSYVMESGQVWKGWETVRRAQGDLVKYRIVKFPVLFNQIIIGVAGLAIPNDF